MRALRGRGVVFVDLLHGHVCVCVCVCVCVGSVRAARSRVRRGGVVGRFAGVTWVDDSAFGVVVKSTFRESEVAIKRIET